MANTLDEMIAVMQAAKEGRDIQYRPRNRPAEWSNACGSLWNWVSCEYRVKTEPRDFWVNFHPDMQCGYAYLSKEEADLRKGCGRSDCIHVREVTE